jgi:hypothetical protein
MKCLCTITTRTCNHIRQEFLASRYFQVSLQGASQE